MEIKKILGIVLLFLMSLMSVHASLITYFDQSLNYTSVTNNAIWTSGFTIAGGWTTLSGTQFAFTPASSSYNRGARFTIIDTALANGEILNITFTNYQTHDRFNNINLYDSAGTSGIGFERSTGAGTPYIGIRSITSSSYSSWNTINAELTYYSNGIKDTSAITYNFLWNGTHGKLIRNGVTDISWTSIKTLKNITKVEVFTQGYQTGTDIIGNLIISKYTNSIPGANVTINSPTATYYNSTSITLNVTTDKSTNLTYSLNGGANQTLCSNCNNTQTTITGIEGANTIQVYSNLSGEITSDNVSFTIDTTNPTINNSIPSNSSTYAFNGSWFSCSDSNIASCNISIDGLNKASGTNFNLTHNGNLSYNITAIDLAGNRATTSGVLFVNPYQYFYFTDLSSNPLSNFTFGGTSYGSYAAISLFDLGYGNQTLEFIKLGYQSKNVSFTLNSTSNINLTTQTGVTSVNLRIYNRETLNLINTTINIDLIGDPDNAEEFAGSFSTSNGTLTINNITDLPGLYELAFFSSIYANNEYYFTHTGYAALNISIYLINATGDIYPIKFIVRDITNQDPIAGCIVKVKQYFIDVNDYLVVDMGKTNSLGEVIFDLEYDVKYQYVTECEGQTQTEPGQKITSNPIYINFNPASTLETFASLPNVQRDLEFYKYNSSNTTGYFRFEYNDIHNAAQQGCLKVYKVDLGDEELQETKCEDSASATINIDINYSLGEHWIAKGYVTAEGEEHFVAKKDKYFEPGSATWENGFGLWASILIIGVLFLLGLMWHPAAGIFLALLGEVIMIAFKALDVEKSLIFGVVILIIGVIIIRRKG